MGSRQQNRRILEDSVSVSSSTSFATQSRASDFNVEDKKKLVADVVFCIMTQERKRVPHKRADIFKAVGLSGKARDLQDEIFSRAVRRIKEAFGVKVVNLGGDKNVFVLINSLKLESSSEHLKLTDHQQAVKGLLKSVLTLIFMSGGVVKEDQLVNFLVKSNLHGETTNEDREAVVAGGNVKQFIEKELGARQHYIDVKKVDRGDAENPILEYRWGERANLEVKKSKILSRVCKVYKCTPAAFAQQLDQVKQEEGENAMADFPEPMEVDGEANGNGDSEDED